MKNCTYCGEPLGDAMDSDDHACAELPIEEVRRRLAELSIDVEPAVQKVKAALAVKAAKEGMP